MLFLFFLTFIKYSLKSKIVNITPISNIDNNKKCRVISEGSCDTDCSDAENSALHYSNKLYLNFNK